MNSITFLTRYYPPSLNINGEAVCDLVEYIQANSNIECNVVQIDNQRQTTGGKQRKPLGNIIKVKNYLDYNTAVFRGIKMLLDGYLLVRRARKIKNTLFVITTSPPLLPFWAGVVAGKKKEKSFLGIGFIPEAFKAKGSVSAKISCTNGS